MHAIPEPRGWPDFRALPETTTNAAGIFEFADLEPGNYQLVARKQGLVGHLPRKIAVTLAGYLGDITIEMGAGRSIAGRVTTQEGVAVRNADVGLYDKFSQQSSVRGRSGNDGRYRIDGVAPGRFTLVAEAAGYSPTQWRDLVIADRDLENVDIVLAKVAVVSGKVRTPDGKAVAGARVDGHTTPGNAGIQMAANSSASTRADGSFEFGGLAPGELHLEAHHPDHGYTRAPVSPLRAGERKQVDLVLKGGSASVAGRVTWPDGSPASGIVVSVSRVRSDLPGPHSVTTGQDGRYEISRLTGGTYAVTAAVEDRELLASRPVEPAVRRIRLEEGERKEGIDLVLEAAEPAGDRIRGVVVGPHGDPVSEAAVSASGEKVLSDADGRFATPHLPRGKFTVRVQHPDYPRATVEKVEPGASDLRIVLEKESVLAGHVVGRGGKPVADYNIAAVDPEAPGSKEDAVAVHDPGGRFEIGRLGAGTHELVVTTSGGDVGVLSGIRVRAGETRSGLRIVVARGATLTGRVIEFQSKQPLRSVSVVTGIGSEILSRDTGSDGGFALKGLLAGSVRVTVIPDYNRYLTDFWHVTIRAGEKTHDMGAIPLSRRQVENTGERWTGIRATNRDGKLLVWSVEKGSPAARAGVEPGSAITHVDGTDVRGLGGIALNHLLWGEVGTKVTIGLGGDGGRPRAVTLERVKSVE